MKKSIAIMAVGISLSLFSCQNDSPSLTDAGLIPLPVSVSNSSGHFELTSNSAIQLVGPESDLIFIGEYLAQKLRPSTGFPIQVGTDEADIKLELVGDGSGSEAYELSISESGINISAESEAGLFYGVQTLIQAFPPSILESKSVSQKWIVPAGTITDSPDFAYRGSMLDVARHFFPVEDVKHYIDQMAELKLNYLHLHLTDDQGWRIEIKSWPKLTETGGSTEVGGGEGGFYTQEQYADIVAYAAERYITIVPEVDMPGHTNAILASYGELNPGINLPDGDTETIVKSVEKAEDLLSGSNIDRQAAELYTGIEVGFSTLDSELEATYQLVEDVVRELTALTPGPYFHIGGDESHVTKKDDYIYFVERVQEIVKGYGKTSIGWDEIATTTLLPGNVAQFWDKANNAQMAKDQGNKVLMSPAKRAYMDMQYDSTSRIGLHWAAFIELDDSYNWDPATYTEGISKSDILGVEAPLWTETVTDRADIEYLVFPRLAAIAEVAWTPTYRRSWDSFASRIPVQGKRWEIEGIGFYKSPKVNW